MEDEKVILKTDSIVNALLSEYINMLDISAAESMFPYETFSHISIPDQVPVNFAELAWKVQCNVSDNAYNQAINNKDERYWKLEPCLRELFKWLGVKSEDVDCCQNGKYLSISKLNNS